MKCIGQARRKDPRQERCSHQKGGFEEDPPGQSLESCQSNLEMNIKLKNHDVSTLKQFYVKLEMSR